MNIDQDTKISQENVLFKPDMSKIFQETSNHPNSNLTMTNASIMNRSSMMTYSKIICCICSATIDANERGMCNACARNEITITDGIMKTGQLIYCKGCDRYQRPPWVRCGNSLESPEMMAFCLSKIKGLSKMKLVDSQFIWTEPHSKIIKIKLTVQKEMNKTLVESNVIVEFKIEWTQCDDCKKTFTPHVWSASCQIRQKVSHKRTFMLLEQIILKNKAHSKALNVKEHPEGVDFYFANKSQALAFSDFIKTSFPAKVKESKQLIGMDQYSNIYNYKFSFMIEIAPVCKDDLIVLDEKTAKTLGGCSPILLCHKLSSRIHLIDPVSFKTYDFDAQTYWRHEFRSYVDRKCLEEYMVINVDEEIDYTKKYKGMGTVNNSISDVNMDSDLNASKSTNFMNKNKNKDSGAYNNHNRFKVVTVQCIANNKSGADLITCRSHLGGKIRPGDIFLGYNTEALNLDHNLENFIDKSSNIPDVILVKKKYIRGNTSARKRYWKLKHLDKEVDMGGKEDEKEKQYEEFLRDIEEDKDLRKNVNLYKDDEVMKELEGKFKNLKVKNDDENESEIDIKVDELLEDLHLGDDKDKNKNDEGDLKGHKKDSIDVYEEEVVDTFEKPKGKGKKQIGKRDRGGNKLEESI